MPALNFQKRFAAAVADGRKVQTIRAPRKRPIKPGDRLYLYTGMRTKSCRKLGEGTVERVQGVRMMSVGIVIGGRRYSAKSAFAKDFARRDGFGSFEEMREWFERVHGLPFLGNVIRWRLETRDA